MPNLEELSPQYSNQPLDIKDLSTNPFEQFAHWLDKVKKQNCDLMNAMLLATADKKGRPSSRVVLLKNYDEKGLIFFTNYLSHKAQELEDNPYAALTFWWPSHTWQIHIKGKVEKTSQEISDNYFASRSKSSNLSVYASQQSKIIAGRTQLEQSYAKYAEQFEAEMQIPRPDYWGGYRLVPDSFEFWSGRENRLHDRFLYSKIHDGWKIDRLAP